MKTLVMACSVCGSHEHEATTVGCPDDIRTQLENTLAARDAKVRNDTLDAVVKRLRARADGADRAGTAAVLRSEANYIEAMKR